MTIECLLFDCDGTLVDSERLCSTALASKFSELGIDLDVDVIESRFRGAKLGNILQVLSEEYAVTLHDDFVDEYRALVAELFETDLQAVAGIHQALDQLDLPKAVVSNAPIGKIHHSLQLCDLRYYFEDNIFSAYDVGIWKPDPGLYLLAASEMGFPPEACAVIEDGAPGLEAGLNAGIKTYYYNPRHEDNHFTQATEFNAMLKLPGIINSA